MAVFACGIVISVKFGWEGLGSNFIPPTELIGSAWQELDGFRAVPRRGLRGLSIMSRRATPSRYGETFQILI